MEIIEISPEAFAELARQNTPSITVGVHTDKRLLLSVEPGTVFTTSVVECPDCAAKLQHGHMGRLRHLEHVT